MVDLGRRRGVWGRPVRPARQALQARPKTRARAPNPSFFLFPYFAYNITVFDVPHVEQIQRFPGFQNLADLVLQIFAFTSNARPEIFEFCVASGHAKLEHFGPRGRVCPDFSDFGGR